MANLIEQNGCIFDEEQLALSHGYEDLDPVGKESFVNHVHFEGRNRANEAMSLIEEWERQLKDQWPQHIFRLYIRAEPEEVTLRFHMVRNGVSNWYDGDDEELEVRCINA